MVSLGSEFIENADAGDTKGKSAEEVKQDCELKALQRLLPRIKKTYPQLRFVLALDSLYACGPLFALAQELRLVVRGDVQGGPHAGLVAGVPGAAAGVPGERAAAEVGGRAGAGVPLGERSWTTRTATGALEAQRPGMYGDDGGRGSEQYFAWLTRVAGGQARRWKRSPRKEAAHRWKVENEGFNRQKNSGLNLEHVYSIDPEKWKAYYLLLQIAFILVQLLERGSLLRRLAAEAGSAGVEAVRQIQTRRHCSIAPASSFSITRATTRWPALTIRSANASPEVSFAAVRVSDTVSTAIFTGMNGRLSSIRAMMLPPGFRGRTTDGAGISAAAPKRSCPQPQPA